MRSKNDMIVGILIPAIAGLGGTLLALTAVHAIAAMTHMTPHIGDIVSFVRQTGEPVGDGVRLIVHRSSQVGCILDLGILRRSGGSLIVESQVTEVAGDFRVHWAGERTSADSGNCGNSADLILDRRELDILALGAGGYGVERDVSVVVFENQM
jgi:hypothetical protein